MIAVFARPNHPNYDNGEWHHHGYVVALVYCHDIQQVLEVKRVLATSGLPEPYEGHANRDQYPQGWYGGTMEFLALLDGDQLAEESPRVSAPLTSGRDKQSLGDNRYAGFYYAVSLLDPSGLPHGDESHLEELSPGYEARWHPQHLKTGRYVHACADCRRERHAHELGEEQRGGT